jgi:hypothetical protein
MNLPATPEERTLKRRTFLGMVFGKDSEGFVCISTMRHEEGKKIWADRFFHYPSEMDNMLHYIEQTFHKANVYFCPQLFERARVPGHSSARFKENVKMCTNVWADLDSCHPDLMLVAPSLTIESSPDRFQALWVLHAAVAPEVAEQISKNIAYHHVPDGADNGGWDLTQLLRVPFTYNMKYIPPPMITLPRVRRDEFDVGDFDEYKEARVNARSHDPMPLVLPTETPLDIIQRYRRSVNPIVFSLYDVVPSEDVEGGWSKVLWQLQMLLFEAGMSREEVFVIASQAGCNKYKRDNKHPRLLWEEVCRAYEVTVEKLNILVPETTKLPPLLTEAERIIADDQVTFVERYIEWASSLGDAAVQYHQAGALMALSALLSGSVRLPTSFGVLMPNLWFMLLADTTLTRKSTAMDVAMELVEEVDDEVLLATDGSLEGLLQSMEIRPGKPSVFLRDEFSGLIEAMTKKDYMAGMAEALTKLYDGKTMKRVLKRETITVKEPCLLIFGGGIKTRVQSLLTLDHVASGFVPRFIFLSAESDVSRLQPLGPPTEQNLADREVLLDELRELKAKYVHSEEIILKGQIVAISNTRYNAYLNEETWARYNQLEATMLYAGVQSDQPDIMTPVYDRLSKSILKTAVLVAASRMRKGEDIEVRLEDFLVALKYGEGWRNHATEIINGIGRSANEIQLQRILASIRRHPGVSRAMLMQWFHLEARHADLIFATMEQRGLILGTRMGRTTTYEAIGRIKVHDPSRAS